MRLFRCFGRTAIALLCLNVFQLSAQTAEVKEPLFHSSPLISGKFSAKVWKESILPNYAPSSREDELRRFLQEHNVIGMSHEQIATYLGNENRLSAYTIAQGPDGFWRGFYIHYENGKAQKWRLMQGIGHGQWCTENAIWPGSNGITGPDGKLWFCVPKRLLEQTSL